MNENKNEEKSSFVDLGLSKEILKAIDDLGYKQPSKIQEQCIPYLLNGEDVLGIAQTGSGKTAAFALPMLMKVDASDSKTQILVLAPTRELAIQVANSFEDFAKYIPKLDILPIYGGQRYDTQLRALKRGVQVVIGTPGRLLDHLKKGTLNLSHLKYLVLDEADEMLRMGFIDDVEAILSEIPKDHQTALFSATMPEPIRRITRRFMNDPKEVKIKVSTQNAPNIAQSYWRVFGLRKNDAVVRFLEMEDFDAAIIFVRTKNATLELAEFLDKNGYNVAALNGDMNQATREQTLERLKNGKLDILIATDVAARGLDVERISLVINYDLPLDSESYVHRIGRTGRAGRAGRAISLMDNRERRILQSIERLMKISIPEVSLPTAKELSQRRIEKFAKHLKNELNAEDLPKYITILNDLNFENIDPLSLSAALLKMAQGERKLIVPEDNFKKRVNNSSEVYQENRRGHQKNSASNANLKMDLYRLEVGKDDGIEVRHIVGAIANEANINSRDIGHIKLYNNHSTIELPTGFAKDLLAKLKNTRILNKPAMIKLEDPKGRIRQQASKETKRNKKSNSDYSSRKHR